MASASTSSVASADPNAKFEDFDHPEVFERAKRHVTDCNSQNFVVEFGYEKARIAFDLTDAAIQSILEGERDTENYPIRWINIWNPVSQSDAVARIGKHYDFSERLIGLMTARPRPNPPSRSLTLSHRHRSRDRDIEAGTHGRSRADTFHLMPYRHATHHRDDASMEDADDSMETYLQVKNTVKYCSTDQTPKALCIGAHWLHKRPKGAQEDSGNSIMPPNIWQWLTLCHDHTVLSIHEAPTFGQVPERHDPGKWREKELKYMRANTLDVLVQLSEIGFDLYRENPLSQNSVRRPLSKWHNHGTPNNHQAQTWRLSGNHGERFSMAEEGSSNLFYYLFEDYVAAEPLKTAEIVLEQMTSKVLDGARPTIRRRTIDIIPTLHYLSKDLRELKHLVANYKNLISKITVLCKPDAGAHHEDVSKIMLTDTAISRFERLGDRLQYLMMNSIQGYLEEISALSSTYFNLTQQKDSEATARLTRSATLLAKLSVFFLPISFMTSYFSVQIEDLYKYWHGTDYWYSFAVIASVSFASLFFFSRLLMFFSDVLDDWSLQISVWFRYWTGLHWHDEDD